VGAGDGAHRAEDGLGLILREPQDHPAPIPGEV
jgi:hypothetical protein